MSRICLGGGREDNRCMKKCRECGKGYALTPDKPGFVWQCGECGGKAERVERVAASQAEGEDGLDWHVERRRREVNGRKLNIGLRLVQRDLALARFGRVNRAAQ